MLEDVISLVFSQLNLNARDIFVLRRICTTWKRIIHARTKRISFDRGTNVTTSMLRTINQFSALFLDLNFTKCVFKDDFGETLATIDGLIGLDLSRVGNQELLRGYPRNLLSLHGALYAGNNDNLVSMGQQKSFRCFKSESHSMLHLSHLQELTLGRLLCNEASFLSQLATTLHTLSIAKNESNTIDLNAASSLSNLRTFRCSLDPRCLKDPMPCSLTQLLNLDVNFDWKTNWPRMLPCPETDLDEPIGIGKLTFPLSNYKLQSLSLSPLVLFPAPPDCNPNPFVNLTGLTSLTFQLHALSTLWFVCDAIPIDLCICLAPLNRLESFRLFYCKKSFLNEITDLGFASYLMIGRNFIPNEIVLTSFLHLHTPRLRWFVNSDENFKAVNYDFLASLTNLRSLDLTDRGIPDVAFTNMSKLPFLWRLKLGCTNLSNESLELFRKPLVDFRSLKHFTHASSFRGDTQDIQHFFWRSRNAIAW
jgi:hypothetical protein